MSEVSLFTEGVHRNLLLEAFDSGEGVPANQHLIVHGKGAVLLDPGGHKVYKKVLAATLRNLGGEAKLTHLFLSHQDPDIVAAVNGWLMTTDATAYLPAVWKRFVAHFGVDRLVIDRLVGVPDEGQWIQVGGAPLLLVPAHYLHSCGNFQVWDPTSRILYSGDLGASVGETERVVTDFEAHLRYMTGFHRRYMPSTTALRAWAQMVRQLPIQTIAPQHGAMFQGEAMVDRFLTWCEQLTVGIEANPGFYQLPAPPSA